LLSSQVREWFLDPLKKPVRFEKTWAFWKKPERFEKNLSVLKEPERFEKTWTIWKKPGKSNYRNLTMD
jgi:hypothetical protein